MKLATAILILLFILGAAAQESTPRRKLLESKGANKTSTLFKEPVVLPTDDQKLEAYRLTVIPTFHGPLSLRVDNLGGKFRVIAKQLNGSGGYKIGGIRRVKIHGISSKQWAKLLELMKATDFWNAPYREPKNIPSTDGSVEICSDGAEWTLEAVKNGEYHVINRYCPSDLSLRSVGLYLLALSRLNVKSSNLYR